MSQMFRASLSSSTFLLLGLVLVGCETDPPGSDGGLPDAAPSSDAGPAEPPRCEAIARTPAVVSCEPLATDYAPGVDDMWPECVSDDGTYHRIDADISSVARVAAFEELRELLFDPTRDPTPEDFLAGRLIYQREQGLDSRVVRRYDPAVEVPEGTDCTAAGTPEAFPDHCVGPARIQPLLLGAFEAGIRGASSPRVQAARIEAGLLWFLYVSTAKEGLTCARTPKDCDSAYAYYTGGEPARGGVGLAADVAAVDPVAHDRAWDGALALRCWRDLDREELATDLERQALARAQYDRALLDGLAGIVRDRLIRSCDTRDAELLHHWTIARTLAPVLDRAARERSPADADALAEELAYERPEEADATRAVAAIDALFECP